MKKVCNYLVVGLLFVFSLAASAQEKNFFVGKWEITVLDTPSGDGKLSLTIEEKERKLTAKLYDEVNKKDMNVDRLENKDNSLIVYFKSGTYSIFLNIEKKDQDNVTGSMMDMFDATGKRVQ